MSFLRVGVASCPLTAAFSMMPEGVGIEDITGIRGGESRGKPILRKSVKPVTLLSIVKSTAAMIRH